MCISEDLAFAPEECEEALAEDHSREPARIVLRSHSDSGGCLRCAICRRPFARDPVSRYGLFLDGTDKMVCHACGSSRDAPLALARTAAQTEFEKRLADYLDSLNKQPQ